MDSLMQDAWLVRYIEQGRKTTSKAHPTCLQRATTVGNAKAEITERSKCNMIERQEFWQWHDVVVQTRNNKLPARIPVITNSTSLELLGTYSR